MTQLDEIDLIYIEYCIQKQQSIHSSANGTFFRIDHMLGHKTSLSKFQFKKIENISSIFSNYNMIRLEINYMEKNCKKQKHVETKQYVTKQPMDH